MSQFNLGAPGPSAFDFMAQNEVVDAIDVQWSRDYFVYSIDFQALAPGAAAQGAIQIQADADFLWVLATQFAFVAGSDPVFQDEIEVPLVTVSVIDTGSGRTLTQGQVPVVSMFGVGKLPYVLPRPRVFKARSAVTFAVQSNAANTTYNLNLSIHGYKIFAYSQGGRAAGV